MKAVRDVSALPTYGFGPRMTMYWGTLAFILLEGFGFAIAVSVYFYLMVTNEGWPLDAPPPDLLPGTASLLLLLLSLAPNHVLKGWAQAQALVKVRAGLVAMAFFGAAPLVIRYFEFKAFHILWDANAYGSIVWVILGLHTAHLLTDLGDTLVLAALMFTRHAHGRRFSDVEDNALYWDFVVLAWAILYGVLYWAPRL
jgi:cytochrome c oxidase subunit 3